MLFKPHDELMHKQTRKLESLYHIPQMVGGSSVLERKKKEKKKIHTKKTTHPKTTETPTQPAPHRQRLMYGRCKVGGGA